MATIKKSRFSGSQIVGVLKQVDAGSKVEGVCCEHGISAETSCNFKLVKLPNKPYTSRLRRAVPHPIIFSYCCVKGYSKAPKGELERSCR